MDRPVAHRARQAASSSSIYRCARTPFVTRISQITSDSLQDAWGQPSPSLSVRRVGGTARVDPSSPPSATDLDVMSQVMAGDQRALGTLYDRHGPLAFSLAAAIVPDAADVEEVVADAFAQIWRSAATFDRTRGSVVAWVATIVRARSIEVIRSQKRRARVLDEAVAVSDERTTSELSSGPPGPERSPESSATQALVQRALRDLPDSQRLVVELAYFGGLTQSEIADKLSVPAGTVKTRMRDGMETLRLALASICFYG